MNPAPDAALESVGVDNFSWVVDHVANMAVSHALAPSETPELRWASFLAGGSK
jgi:hypothetical protein